MSKSDPEVRDVRPRPRVLVLTTTLPAHAGDGTPEFVLSLACALGDDFDCLIVAPRVPGSAKREVIAGVSVWRFGYLPGGHGLANGAILGNLRARPWRIVEVPLFVTAFLFAALRATFAFRPDVVHAHWLLPGGLIALWLRMLRHIPYVVTIHGADAYALNTRPIRAVKRAVIRKASAAVPVSRDIATKLGVGREPLAPVVPMGVDVAAIRRGVGARRPEEGRFLFVGRLAEKKGADVLLAALKSVPEAHLVVAGDGPERRRLERMTLGLGLADRVRFEGRLPARRVIEELRRAHALVIPSRTARGGDSEGTPTVLAEAMAAGVPVVASDLGGLAEQIRHGKTGILVEPGDATGLAEALRMCLRDRATLRTLAGRARRHPPVDLDLETTRRRYEQILLDACRPSYPPSMSSSGSMSS